MQIRHALVREAIYAGMTAARRRELHARAALVVAESASWEHRVAAMDRPDEALAAELERLAREEAAGFRPVLAATHLRWAADISPARADRERRLLTAALYLADETQGVALRPAVEAAAPSPLRSYVLGAMVEADGQLGEAEQRYGQALAEARADPGSQPLAATIAARLAGTYTLRGEGEKTLTLGQWALDTGDLDAAAARQTRTRVAIGASQVVGPREALAALGHLDADPARVDPIDVDGLSWRGIFRLLAGDLGPAVTDMTAGLKMVRQGANLALGQRTYGYLALAQYLAGTWDDALLTAGQGLSAAAIHPYRHELPLFHLAASCVPAGRGAAEEAERHARLAEEVAASLDYGQERLYAAMARALVCQAAGDYLGMADALGYWREDAALDGRARRDAMLWRPLLAEGLIGTGQAEPAADVLAQLRAVSGQVAYLQAALAWLDGWLAELRGRRRSPADLPARRGHRQHPESGLLSPAAAGPRPAAAEDGPAPPGGPAPAPGQRPVPGAGRRAVHRPDRQGTGGVSAARWPGQDAAPDAGADQPGDGSGPPGREGTVQSGDRGRAVHQPQGRGVPPGQHLRQMRRDRTAAATALRRAMAPADRGVTAAGRPSSAYRGEQDPNVAGVFGFMNRPTTGSGPAEGSAARAPSLTGRRTREFL